MFKKMFLTAGAISGIVLNAGIALAQPVCAINGEPIPCDQWVTQTIALIGPVYIFLIFAGLILGLVSFVFWLKMLIHALMHPVNHKLLWIFVLIFTGFLGSIFYYYMAKKDYDRIGVEGPGGDTVILD